MDDVLVYGRDINEHNKRMTETLQRIQAAGVTLNPSKCKFGKRQLKFLDHLVDRDGDVIDMKPPTNITEMRRFMGMVTVVSWVGTSRFIN